MLGAESDAVFAIAGDVPQISITAGELSGPATQHTWPASGRAGTMPRKCRSTCFTTVTGCSAAANLKAASRSSEANHAAAAPLVRSEASAATAGTGGAGGSGAARAAQAAPSRKPDGNASDHSDDPDFAALVGAAAVAHCGSRNVDGKVCLCYADQHGVVVRSAASSLSGPASGCRPCLGRWGCLASMCALDLQDVSVSEEFHVGFC